MSRQGQQPVHCLPPLWTPWSPRSASAAGLASTARPTIFAGAPTAVAPDGTDRSTTAPQPIFAPSPILMLPNIETPAPRSTSRPTLGWRSPRSLPVAPSVTPCRIVQPAPIVAVSPTTTPVPWSKTTALPMVHAGWMSTAKASDARPWSHLAKDFSPRSQDRRATRCATSAAKPLKLSTSRSDSAAGSRSTTAAASARMFSPMAQPPSSARSSIRASTYHMRR
mmetsp:Transcript_25101/g.81147  ORF Transcript_25101/g.81147 Transcript_25101/m.81147 type:complete len:223 (+) Transcript_25101:299-967(+)